ncbi:MAG: hypothetical protein J4A00_11085 [Gammaproteobacteria bacterium]|nr:hypothetical protein [Gammaproteobacteria bacterium]
MRRLLLVGMLIWGCLGVVQAADEVVPERFNKGPRLLFNMADKDAVREIVPGSFYQEFWQGPRVTIQHGRLIKGESGHVKTVPGYHGEEVIILIEGELEFRFPDNGKVFVLKPGDVFHFPNILHGGRCLADECRFIGLYTPNRPDFGDEGSEMSTETNMAITR